MNHANKTLIHKINEYKKLQMPKIQESELPTESEEILYTEDEIRDILDTVLNEILCSKRLENWNLIKYPNSSKITLYIINWLKQYKKKQI